MTHADQAAAAHYIWRYLKARDYERSAEENWHLAGQLLRGDRPAWLCDREDFHLFGTHA